MLIAGMYILLVIFLFITLKPLLPYQQLKKIGTHIDVKKMTILNQNLKET